MTRLKQTISLIMVLASSATLASEQWVRIDNPSSETVRTLADNAIVYPHFIWVEQSELNSRSIDEAQMMVSVDPFDFRLDGQSVDLKHDALPQNPWFSDYSANASKNLYLIQFKGPIKPSWLSQLSSKGIQPVQAMAPFSWVVWADADQVNEVSAWDEVRHSTYMYPAFRVQEDNRSLPYFQIPAMALVVSQTYSETITALEALGAQIDRSVDMGDQFKAVGFTLNGNAFLQAATLPGVFTVQQVDTDGGPRGEMSQQSIVGNYDLSNQIFPGYDTWLSATGLDGTGVRVGVVDGGIYDSHPDLVDNMVSCTGSSCGTASTSDAHGTHVAGAIGGTGVNNSLDGAGFNRGLGVAPGTEIVEQLYYPFLGGGSGGMVIDGMLTIYKDSAVNGVMLTNNSWGPTGSPQGYDIPTRQIDMISRDANPDVAGNQPVLAVWSIMNGGGDSNGSCSPSSLGSPDEAKNLFAVGSTKLQNSNLSQISEIFDVSANSAHGPACDGRLVPHIVAPGCSTDAPSSASGYGTMCGTSMASPVVSGAVSLFWEQYKNTHAIDPSPALVKATFTAITHDLVGMDDADGGVLAHAPTREQGWGRINLDAVINPPNAVWYHDQAHVFAMSGEQWTQSLAAENPSDPMRMMLVWTDAPGPGSGGTSAAWVNDLDLKVTAESQLYLGNELGVDAYSTTGGTADTINNMEAVFLRADQHNGEPIDIEVMAANIAADALNPHGAVSPAQDFALVCYNCTVVPVIDNDLIFSDSFDIFVDLIFEDGFE